MQPIQLTAEFDTSTIALSAEFDTSPIALEALMDAPTRLVTDVAGPEFIVTDDGEFLDTT
jgi:hypothetical protein